MPSTADLAAAIDRALPQTQCTRCGYPDCAGYAQAVAAGGAGINQCPPGGQAGIERLARLTGRPVVPLNPANGVEGPRAIAFIDEAWCIGCTLCIEACPVDCIVGAPKLMHTVVEDQCTGCELCLPACPVDCILLVNRSGTATGWAAWSAAQADAARQRHVVHGQRLDRERREKGAEHTTNTAATPALDPKRAAIDAALARARARRV